MQIAQLITDGHSTCSNLIQMTGLWLHSILSQIHENLQQEPHLVNEVSISPLSFQVDPPRRSL